MAVKRAAAHAQDSDFRHLSMELSRNFAQMAYVADSNFHVGAALWTRDMTVYGGCNVENGVYEGSTCGERGAIFNAVTHGEALNNPRMIDFISVSCIDMPEPVNIVDGSPCGTCRQIINEFAHEGTIVLIDDKKDGRTFLLSELIPNAFRFGPEYDPNAAKITPVSVEEIEQEAAKNPSPENLIQLAREIANNSYVPHSKMRAGAVVVTADGKAYAGVRVENSSTGLTARADRVAIGRAVLNGATQEDARFVQAIAVAQTDPVRSGRGAVQRLINLDILNEFAQKGTVVTLQNPLSRMTYKYRPTSALYL